jgi:hypothetical protein
LILPDVNILINAFRRDAGMHEICRTWLDSVIGGTESFGISPQVLASVFRVTTNPRAYHQPNSIEQATAFAQLLLDHPRCVVIQPGPRHWAIFCDLCRAVKAQGNLVPDAWFAALAIEHGCEWVTDDRDYALFPGLRWRTLREPVN